MKIALTNVYGSKNKGDHFLLGKLLEQISTNEVSAICSTSEETESFFPNVTFYDRIGTIKNKNFKKLFQIFYFILGIIGCYIPVLWELLPKSQKKGLKSLKSARIVFACPGGYLEDSTNSFYAHIIQLIIVIFLKKKLILSPMSIGPAQTIIKQKLILFVLKHSQNVFVREKFSLNFCKNIGYNDAILTNDLAWTGKKSSLLENNRKNIIGLSVIDWNFPHQHNPQELRRKYILALKTTIIKLFELHNCNFEILIQVDTDKNITMELVQKLPSYINLKIVELNTPDEVINWTKSLKLMIASRFHSAIFSYISKTLTIAISYLPKTKFMLEMYNMEQYYIDINKVNERNLLLLVNDLFCNEIHYYKALDEMNEKISSYSIIWNRYLENIFSKKELI